MLKEGDDICIDGFTGEVFSGRHRHASKRSRASADQEEPEARRVGRSTSRFKQIMDWAEEHRKLRVRTNADLPEQAAEAVAFGAEGIGLCRTEHMFFDHVAEMREMIMAENREDREKPPWPRCCRSSATISPACSGRWTAGR